MVNDWQDVTIDSIKSSAKGAIAIGPFGSRMKSDCYVDSGVPVIRGTNITGSSKFDGNFVFITKEKAHTLGSSNVFDEDLVFPHRGSIGEVGLVPKNSHYVLSSSLMKLTCDTSKANPKFIYYFFKSDLGKHELLKNASQVGTPGIGQPLSSLKACVLKLPPLAEQKAIAHILGSLDDKIELNRQMNETLEAMAQALFKSWFVDFDPVIDNALAAGNAIPDELLERAEQRKGIEKKENSDIQDLFPDEFEFTEEMGWIPKGWGVRSLDEVADYLNGLALQKYRPEDIDDNYLPIVKIAQLREGLPNHDEKASINIKPEYIIDNGDVIFSWSGSLLVDVWCGGKAALNQHLFKVTSDKYPKWFYLNYTKHHLVEFQRIATDKAVTMGHIKRGHLKEALCVIPENGVDDNVFAVFEDILNKQIRSRIESQTLAKLRDTLLPKLMSGELRIADAIALVDEAV